MSETLTKESPIERLERLERKSFKEPLRLHEWRQRWFLSHADADYPEGYRMYSEYIDYLERWAKGIR